MIPLAYIIQIDSQVLGNAPPLTVSQLHSTEHGSVEGELVVRTAHTHALYRDDNSMVYYHLEEATREPPMQHQSSLFKEEKMEGGMEGLD